MSKRYKVLISAYSCKPGFGSESGIGWNVSLEMARRHDITVLTRPTSRPLIEQGLEALPVGASAPRFVFFEHSRMSALSKRWGIPGSLWWRYNSWQNRARLEVARLHAEFRFDLLHHLTWATYRSVPAIWGHGVPTVWGPISGNAATPWHLLPWRWPRDLTHELVRIASNRLAADRLATAARYCSAIIVSTEETRQAFARAGVAVHLLPESGIHKVPEPKRRLRFPRLKLVFAGRVVFYKGVHLALHALKAAGVEADFAVFGDGTLRRGMQRLARRLNLGSQVTFHGWVSRDQLLNSYADFDVFLFPSLHDGIPQALLEAMANGLPVICLNCGGPGRVVVDGCGLKIPPGRFDEMVRGIAGAITHYNIHRDAIVRDGTNGWRHVMREYRWEQLGQRIGLIYQQVLDDAEVTDIRRLRNLPMGLNVR